MRFPTIADYTRAAPASLHAVAPQKLQTNPAISCTLFLHGRVTCPTMRPSFRPQQKTKVLPVYECSFSSARVAPQIPKHREYSVTERQVSEPQLANLASLVN